VAYDCQFSLFFKERHSPYLDAMFDDVLELESNMVASKMMFISHSQSLKKGEDGKGAKVVLFISNHMDSCLQGLITHWSSKEDKKPTPNLPLTVQNQ